MGGYADKGIAEERARALREKIAMKDGEIEPFNIFYKVLLERRGDPYNQFAIIMSDEKLTLKEIQEILGQNRKLEKVFVVSREMREDIEESFSLYDEKRVILP